MEKIKLKRCQIRELYQAITDLNGRPEVVRDKDGSIIGQQLKPYEFSTKATYALSRTMRSISDEFRALQNARRRRVLDDKERDGKNVKDDSPSSNVSPQCEREIMEIEDELVEVEVHRLPLADLRVDVNHLAPSVLAGLDPIIVGE